MASDSESPAQDDVNESLAHVQPTASVDSTSEPEAEAATSASGNDTKFIDGRWVCSQGSGVYLEYVEESWRPVADAGLPAIIEAWSTATSAAQQQSTTSQHASAQRWVDGKWLCPLEDGFVEFIDESWVAVPSERVEEVRAKYAAALDPVGSGEGDDEDFLAAYQANYGISYDYSQLPTSEKERKLREHAEKVEKKKAAAAAMKEPQPEGWTDIADDRNTNVYVSHLPTDITEEEFIEFMSKAGVVMKDPRTNKPKVKLYRTPDGNLKGDGTCCYVKMESVKLAIDILDGWNLRSRVVHVEKAKFVMKGQFDPSKKKRKLTADQKKRFMNSQNKQFEWVDDKPRNYRPTSHCTVILKNVFGRDEMLQDVTLALDLKNHVKDACDRFGTITKVVTYENHADGVVGITFSTVEEADYCISLMNNGILRGRQITAENWDGKTKYNVKESHDDVKKREEEWDAYLRGSDDEEEHHEAGESPAKVPKSDAGKVEEGEEVA